MPAKEGWGGSEYKAVFGYNHRIGITCNLKHFLNQIQMQCVKIFFWRIPVPVQWSFTFLQLCFFLSLKFQLVTGK